MDIGRIGIWTGSLLGDAKRAQDAAAELEQLGYRAIWLPETPGRDPIAYASVVLSGTRSIVVATGIANVWLRTPAAMAGAQATLGHAFPDRFLLGLGISHGPLVEGVLRETYDRPLARMRAYLDGMDAMRSNAEGRVLAALGDGMLALARDRAAGAHPYFVPVEHTAQARKVLGPGKLLATEQAVVLETDPSKARELARGHMAVYLNLPNYANNLRRLGWGDEDLSGGGTDRLVDAIVAWGDVETVAARVRDHLGAGADHVCLQVITADFRTLPLEQWRELAGALRG